VNFASAIFESTTYDVPSYERHQRVDVRIVDTHLREQVGREDRALFVPALAGGAHLPIENAHRHRLWMLRQPRG
jgi:hypothetical protein